MLEAACRRLKNSLKALDDLTPFLTDKKKDEASTPAKPQSEGQESKCEGDDGEEKKAAGAFNFFGLGESRVPWVPSSALTPTPAAKVPSLALTPVYTPPPAAKVPAFGFASSPAATRGSGGSKAPSSAFGARPLTPPPAAKVQSLSLPTPPSPLFHPYMTHTTKPISNHTHAHTLNQRTPGEEALFLAQMAEQLIEDALYRMAATDDSKLERFH